MATPILFSNPTEIRLHRNAVFIRHLIHKGVGRHTVPTALVVRLLPYLQ